MSLKRSSHFEEDVRRPEKRSRLGSKKNIQNLPFDIWLQCVVFLDPWIYNGIISLLTIRLWPSNVALQKLHKMWHLNNLILCQSLKGCFQVYLYGRVYLENLTNTISTCITKNGERCILFNGFVYNPATKLPSIITKEKTQIWTDRQGRIHRSEDLPAVIAKDGTQEWFVHGFRHRDNDNPAIIKSNGARYWCQKNAFHRSNDLPAIVYKNGDRYWYHTGHMHRENDKPAMVLSNGTKIWCYFSKIHRDHDKPAIIQADGTQIWMVLNRIHRENDEPAIIHANGTRVWARFHKIHRNRDQPAIIYHDGTMVWYHKNIIKREDGKPAWIVIGNKNINLSTYSLETFCDQILGRIAEFETI